MNDRRFKYLLLCTALALTLSCGRPARAGLGGDAAGVLADAAQMHGITHSIMRQQYEIIEISAESGVRVREFLNRGGSVFAVAWSGPVVPDLQNLLGANFAAYAGALAALRHPGLHRSLRTASPDLVVESGGHLRAYRGRAYLPPSIPSGVSAEELR